jgi:hypothetical protein
VQSEDPRHRRRFRIPRASQPQHQRGNRRERMPVDLPQINCPARSAAGAEHVKPRCPGDQRGPDRWRPQHIPAGGKLLIPSLDDGLRLRTRGSIGDLPFGLDGAMSRPRVRTPIAEVCPAAAMNPIPGDLNSRALGSALSVDWSEKAREARWDREKKKACKRIWADCQTGEESGIESRGHPQMVANFDCVASSPHPPANIRMLIF